MKKFIVRISTIVFITLAMQLLSGCSSKNELAFLDDEDAEDIYLRARSNMNIGEFEAAIEIFNKLESLYPFSQYATQSQLDLMYAYYRFNEGESAISQADKFIRYNPTHPQLDYVMYMKGVIQQNDRKGLFDKWSKSKREDFDVIALKEAYETFNRLIQEYSNSKYAADTRQRMIYIRNTIAENEWKIADFYYNRYQYVAASNRAKLIVQNYPKTKAARKALLTMQKSYQALGMNDLANNIQRIIDLN